LGCFWGGLFGAAIGVGVGMACVKIFNVSDFEGGSGMLVFFTFMPLGALNRRPWRGSDSGTPRSEAACGVRFRF